jgi:hypothetical protein
MQTANLSTITAVAHVLDPLYFQRIFKQAQRKSLNVTGRYGVCVTETLSLNNQTKRTEVRYISVTPSCTGCPGLESRLALLSFFFFL